MLRTFNTRQRKRTPRRQLQGQGNKQQAAAPTFPIRTCESVLPAGKVVAMSPLEKFSKWVQLKVYQVEVTYSVYIFTPAEKFVFCMSLLPSLLLQSSPFIPSPCPYRFLTSHPGSVLFLLFSLTLIAI